MANELKLKVNGKDHAVQIAPETPLAWVLRENLGLTGTKVSCAVGLCGACTVHVDGKATRSCVVAVSDVVGQEITTIEGLSEDGLHPVQKAWIDHSVAQCGFCQSGFIMAAASFLAETPHPTETDIAQNLSNICRCSTFVRVKKAVMAAAKANGGNVHA